MPQSPDRHRTHGGVIHHAHAYETVSVLAFGGFRRRAYSTPWSGRPAPSPATASSTWAAAPAT